MRFDRRNVHELAGMVVVACVIAFLFLLALAFAGAFS